MSLRKPKSIPVHLLPTATVIPFPQPLHRNRLTVIDRLEAEAWASGLARFWCKMIVYADRGEDEEIGDFISIYKLGQNWASWGAARRKSVIVLWRADCGADLGQFPSMREALDAIMPSSQR